MALLLRDAASFAAEFRLVLASASPRRRELLSLLGLPFDTVTSGFPEDLDKARFSPCDYVLANAREKCAAVVRALPVRGDGARRALVVGADTVVSVNGEILEKPPDAAAARCMLASLAGRTHEVFTGIATSVEGDASIRTHVERTEVDFCDLSEEEIDAYISTGEPFDKAGGYGIQSKGSLLVKGIRGDFYNVVGLPVLALARLLASELADARAEKGAPKRPKLADAGVAFIDKLALIVVQDRKQLVARSYGKTAFYTPGGKREAGETDVEALAREVKEELDVDLRLETVRPYGTFQAQAHGKPEGTQVRITCYTADYSGTLAACNEIEELRWITSCLDRSLLSQTGVMILEDLKAKDLVD